MKILEAQVCLLSNYEVYQQILDIRADVNAFNKNDSNKIYGRMRSPDNLYHLQNEMLEYFRKKPNPLREQEDKQNYNEDVFDELLERLMQEELWHRLSKGEGLCIFNIRPMCTAVLNGVIEDMDSRFTEQEQNRMVDIITQVLGRDDPDPGEEGTEGECEEIEDKGADEAANGNGN